ncbi:MAG: XdhC family protein, partial [Cyclobacteriaceae bacterium]|nr:XdhC family protein [Cyclobacteriaceae bacterium]
MYNELYEQMKPLMESGEVFAFAQVVWRQAPCSGKPGDKAIVRKDGSVIGWIGGGCVKGILIKEGLEAIKDQHYRLVKVYPGGQQPDQQEDEHIKIYNMTCYSGGSMEIYIEPVIPNPHLVIVGKSHIARSLAGIAKAA